MSNRKRGTFWTELSLTKSDLDRLMRLGGLKPPYPDRGLTSEEEDRVDDKAHEAFRAGLAALEAARGRG